MGERRRAVKEHSNMFDVELTLAKVQGALAFCSDYFEENGSPLLSQSMAQYCKEAEDAARYVRENDKTFSDTLLSVVKGKDK